jgi:mismatch-specific thymine-DNA glycosylase
MVTMTIKAIEVGDSIKGTVVRQSQGTLFRKRLIDRIGPEVRILFVGINPGLRSAATGHHFAGHSNRFWKLLFESKLVQSHSRTKTIGAFQIGGSA